MDEYEMCRHCQKDIPVSNYQTHTIHCAKNAKASALLAKQSQFDTEKVNISNVSSNSDNAMLPCEFCDELIPMRKLLEHQAECVNPTNVRRNDSCSSMLSRNSSSSSSVRPSVYSNTSTSLNRSTSSVNNTHGKHGSTRSSNYLSPSTGNGDSGFCTSPRPESTQSTISNTNAHRNNTSKEESLCSKKEDDPQDERVPCEFCGDLRIKETIMRHQRHCSLNPRRSAVEVTANTTYDTTSLRRSQARRNYSLNRTNSVREARATTEDRTFGGSRLSRQSSFSERSRWRDAGGGTVNMGLSVVPKADFTSYGRMGRPGYDYAAATRRSGLFDGYTGFAIYSSISQGLDEITYGGRRSRRNSISENTYGASGTSLSRRGSFANISDYSAMLAASAAIEAATKPKDTEDDESCSKIAFKDEKKKDACNLDLTPSNTYSNSSKISRQSSIAYQSDSAFSESSPGLSSKYSHQSQLFKPTVSMGYSTHSTHNEKYGEKDDTVVPSNKVQEKQSQQRTLSPSSLEVSKPQSILSRQESLTHSQSTTKIERKVSFTDGPIASPDPRPVSTMEKDGKREKRKKDKENETAEEKEARRAERRKRRALKELKKAEKSKEKEADSAQNGENCGALLIEVSQKLLALEKEQQDSPEIRESMKSPLEVIPPSSLLSGINDERSSQLQILQKQKQQQQDHLREQQRLEQEKIDEQKMIHQQQKWLLQNEQMLKQGNETNNETVQSCNAINEVKTGIDVKTSVSLTNGKVLVGKDSDTIVKDKFILDPKDDAIKRLDSTIVEKQIAQDEIEDSGNGSDPSAASSPTTTSKKGHLLNGHSMTEDNENEMVVLRDKDNEATKQDKNASKRNSLDGKTVQGLAQDLAAECAKAYALMENSLSKFSNDFGPFGITPRNRKSKKKEAKE